MEEPRSKVPYFPASSFPVAIVSVVLAVVLWRNLRTKKPKQQTLSWEEEEAMLKEFEPMPLVPETESGAIPRQRIIQSRAGKYIVIDGVKCLNLATFNHLGFLEDEEITRQASESISKYGVGSCGPRGFYGTADVHIELEERLAEFLEVEEACVYSYGFCTAASAIPAYCKTKDIIFADEAVNFSIQKGLDASRSKIVYFRHNDTKHLEELLLEHQVEKNNRRFLVAEGVYLNTGNLCPLPELVRLRSKHMLRMFLDESVSFGTVGKTGRGVLEHFNVPNHEVDLRIGSMEGSLASIGGFCCGASFIVEHQRLSGLGYCFSASLPPLLAVTAIKALEKLKNDPVLVNKLESACINLHRALQNLPGLKLVGCDISPVKHLRLKNSVSYAQDRKVLETITDACIKKGLAVTSPSYLPNAEKFPMFASLRITANSNLSDEDIKFTAATIAEACKNLL